MSGDDSDAGPPADDSESESAAASSAESDGSVGTGESEQSADPIAVQQQVPGGVFFGMKYVAGDDFETWAETEVESILNDVVGEAQAGAATVGGSEGDTTDESEPADAEDESPAASVLVEPDTVLVTVVSEPERTEVDGHDASLADRALDTIVGLTASQLRDPATIQVDLYGATAAGVREYVENAEQYSSPVEFVGHRIFDQLTKVSD